MDVDNFRGDEPISNFSLGDQFAWGGGVCDLVRSRRADMSGLLFFDILLQLGGIDNPSEVYPPDTPLMLYRLLEAIKHASYDSMKQDCLIYYLLKQQSDASDEGYAYEKVISPHYAALADVYWSLDSGLNIDIALAKLSDARIVKDYTTKVMETLALEPNSGPLIRKFVRTCNPALREPADLERYMIATAEHSVVEAWQYQRTFPDTFPGRKVLIHKLLVWTLAPKPKPEPLTHLLSVPFSKYEESVLQEFAMHPPEELPAASTTVVRDMVCVRLIQSCKHVAAVKFDRQYPSSGASARGTWGAERERIMKEVLSIMPAAERTLLESELEDISESARVRTSSPWNGSNLGASGSTDLGASWEDIGRRTPGAHRRSMGGLGNGPISSRAPRNSLSNGTPVKSSLYTPEASTSATRPPQPLSAHPTLVSQTDTVYADGPSLTFTSTLLNSSMSQPSPPRKRTASAALPKIVINGANGSVNNTPKISAFTSRNAFFEPPEPRSPSPEVFETNGAAHKSPSKRPEPRRMPTPPQDEPELEATQQTPHIQEVANDDELKSVDGKDRSMSEREDLSFSIFRSATPTTRLTPPSGTTSPKGRRRSSKIADGNYDFDQEQEDVRKALKISVPGAFVFDEEHDHDHELLSSLRVTADARSGESFSVSHKPAAPTSAGRRSSRKRAASPAENVDDGNVRISIPGTLFADEEEEDDEHSYSKQANGRGHTRENGIGHGSEDDDELAPLPSQRTRRRAAVAASAALRSPKKSRARASRAESVESEEGLGMGAGRGVRRSSRLSTTFTSPGTDVVEKVEKKNLRPRKSPRTAGEGATATGKGVTRRR